MKLLYFAWMRQRIGTGEETVDPPASVTTVAELVEWLSGRGEGHEAALAQRDLIRVAVNQEFAFPGTPVSAGDEIAIFPPVTGG